MEKKGIIPQYILTVLLFLMLAGLVVSILIFDKVNIALNDKSNELRMQETRYAYRALQENAIGLREAAAELKIQKHPLQEATLNLLKYADYLHSKYRAVITEGINQENGLLSVRMTLEYYPANSQAFIYMLEDILSSRNPSVYIYALSIQRSDTEPNIFNVKTTLDLSHPYFEGEINETR